MFGFIVWILLGAGLGGFDGVLLFRLEAFVIRICF